jgi:prepilin-type N-terminal cleavage/methylation domain-containing protein
MTRKIQTRQRRQAGFSLIELLVVVLLLTIVVGALFSQIERAQVRYRVEDQQLDLTQQQREFIDQFTRDLHQAGYPAANMYVSGVNVNLIARGIIAISPTDVQLEGDVDGDGVVDQVEYSYFDGAGWPGPGPNPCPCIRRSSIAKGSAGPATSFTEVQGVITTADPIFTAYNSSGGLVGLPASLSDLKTIKTVRITLTTQGIGRDNDTRKNIQVTMTGMARLVNN